MTIQYYDRASVNPDFAGGPLWTGHVDTSDDTLTIETWTELPLHGIDYWMPRNLPAIPLVWPARDALGNHYNVPDTFDGHINNEFAFISDENLRQMEWKRAIFGPNPDPDGFPPIIMTGTEDVEYTLDTGEIWPGWGGYAHQKLEPGVGIVKVYETAQPVAGQPAFDERIMPALPLQAPDASDPTFVASTNATITAVPMPLDPATIPEARQWLLMFAAFFAALGIRWLTNRGRTVAARTES